MGMNMLALLLMFQFGVLINNPYPDQITIVRTDQEPGRNHHSILDDSRYSRLLPYTVTIKVHEKAIKVINVVFDVVDQNGQLHSLGCIYMKSHGSGNAMERGSRWEFWPGGRMSSDIQKPLMQRDPIDLEHARSVTFSIDYVQFEDGKVIGPNYRNTQKNLDDHERLKGR